MRFWDSSALVPLVVRQPLSTQVEGWLADDPEVVTWTLSGVEVVSAIRRLVRDGALAERTARVAEGVARDVVRATHAITDVEGVKSLAHRLLRLHALRAADALQLAAGLAWIDGHPAGAILHTLDRRLALAADREGFEVIPAL